jgi:hypothetical protein
MGNGSNPTSHSHKLEWILVIIGIAGLIIAFLAWRKPVSPASEQSGISHPFTNVVGLSAPLINQAKTANPAQAQPGNSNQLAKFQEAELPKQIKPKEEEPAPEKAVDELKAYQTRDLGAAKASFKADSPVPQLQSTAATDNNVLSSAGGGADLSDDKPMVVKIFGNLLVELQSLKIINGGQYFLTMTLTNRSAKDSLWVALSPGNNGNTKVSLHDKNGSQFDGQNTTGISYARLYPFARPVTGPNGSLASGGFQSSIEIKPGDTTTATITFVSLRGGPRASPGICNLQIEFVVGNDLIYGMAESSASPNLISKMEAK